MAENRLSSTLKDSGFELYFDPAWMECFRASMNWVIWTFYLFFLEK